MNIDQMLNKLLDVEGGYTNNPNDRGGETNFGITVATARSNGFTGPMRAMTKSEALSIYRQEYWHNPGFDLIATVAMDIAAELFECGVNMGPKVAAMFLQRLLNVFNREQHDYRDIPVDGQCGHQTLEALNDFLTRRGNAGEHVLLKALNVLQGARYIELAERRQADEMFVYGWLDQRVSMSL